MKTDTVRFLNRLNRDFYSRQADEFNRTRRRSWRGWLELDKRVELGKLHLTPPEAANTELRVLDIGCGNARFYEFLEEYVQGSPIDYWGIDASELGLGLARLPTQGNNARTLLTHDFLESEQLLPAEPSSPPGGFQLVVLFGVLHHVPSKHRRQWLLQSAAKALAAGGILVYTAWQFERFERLREKIVPWSVITPSSGFDRNDLDEGDYLVSWGHAPSDAYRYCHALSDQEAEDLSQSLEATLIHRFLADGQNEALNEYWVFQK